MKNLNKHHFFRRRCRKKGFTLVEMVITISIVVILTLVSTPIYKDYQSKAKYAEAYALLGAIRSAQESYYADYGNFLGSYNGSAGYAKWWTCNEEVLGVNARTNKYFTLFASGYGGGKYYFPYGFRAFVMKPEELRDNGKAILFIGYNVTEGVTYWEDNTY